MFAFQALLVSLLAWQQAPSRDTRAPVPRDAGTAVVSGRVLDKETGLPLPRVMVILRRMDVPDDRPPRFVKSADDGRYRFTGVAAGAYVLGAHPADNRPTHVAQLYGASAPLDTLFGTSPRPTQIEVRDGEVRQNLDIVMWRALAIAGTVVNDAGEPLADVRVQARRIVRGRALSGPPARSTDDRGAFRIFGLPPGRYRVCTQADGLLDETRAEPERLVSTCFPSATREGDAGVVTLAVADVPDLQIRVQQARTVRLSGTVLDATGGPAAQATVNVESRDRLDRYSGNVAVRAGRFTVEGLLPGEYRLLAYAEGPDSSDFRSGQLGLATVKVDSDSDEVVLMMTRAASVAGHAVFEDAPIPRMTGRLTVRAAFAPGGVSPPPAPVGDDLTFEIKGLFGPQLLMVTNLPPEWTLKSVRYNSADITDVPVTFTTSSDPRVLQIAMTNRGPVVSGRVLDENGQPFGGARIFLFPADPERRRRGGADAQAGDDGSFSLGRQRPGDYLVVAVDDEDVRFDEQPDFELLAKVAERVTLHEAEQRSLTLRLARLREGR